jgi:hypothetical protein
MSILSHFSRRSGPESPAYKPGAHHARHQATSARKVVAYNQLPRTQGFVAYDALLDMGNSNSERPEVSCFAGL